MPRPLADHPPRFALPWRSGAVALAGVLAGCGGRAPAPGERGEVVARAAESPGRSAEASISGSTRAEGVVGPDPAAIDPASPWLVVGGGGLPEGNQVSIEQDLGLAAAIFRGEPPGSSGAILFAAGPGRPVVQVLARRRGDPLGRALGELFAPRGGRDASYRPSTLAIAGEATVEATTQALERALAVADAGPLLVYVAGHGERGATPRENTIELWGQGRLGVAEVAALADAGARPLRLVLTTCYSGGFAELVFTAADPQAGAAAIPRCGLFATTWDLEASGCDPNPDRRAQEGYGLHFLHALGGRDREGAPLPRGVLDADGDGTISLLEAHTRARIAARGIGVPTTTSERWLREVAPAAGPEVAVELPEEQAVIAALGDELGGELGGGSAGPEAALVALEALETAIHGLQEARLAAATTEDEAYRRAAAALLGRWPILDDPWHPEFAGLLAAERPAIEGHLAEDPSYHAYLEARAEVDRIDRELADRRGEAARYERLTRAHETLALAGRLAARGGPDWAYYQAVLACERGLPPAG